MGCVDDGSMERAIQPVDIYCVRSRPAGQELCLNLDNICVPRRRKSLILNAPFDKIYVSHQVWCGT